MPAPARPWHPQRESCNPFYDPITGVPPHVSTWNAQYGDMVPGPDDQAPPIPTLHIGEPFGGIDIYIPNNPDPNMRKVIFVQIASDKAPNPNSPEIADGR